MIKLEYSNNNYNLENHFNDAIEVYKECIKNLPTGVLKNLENIIKNKELSEKITSEAIELK